MPPRSGATSGFVLALASVMAMAAPAAADVHDLELTVPVALMDRSAAMPGTIGGYGYESETGLASGLETRLFFGDRGDDVFHLGVMLGAQHHAGPLFGLVDGHAFRTTVIDAGLTARVLFPCMSRGDVKWRLGGVLALVGAHSDAGTGVGGEDEGPDANARTAASATLDHGGLGWRLAFDLSWHIESFVAGVGLGVRQYFGIDTPVSRVWMMDLGLRIGARFDLFPAPTPVDRYRYE